ncbi:colorectal mutant cancer protein-like isoform X1 [Orbicella faveolata]|uniref:colorectal mutant cancer protein-like isoform X1 n=1 Tax=Orbicella faveolata TaxID=48498 RepID=UPI0009E376BC|nr:colorectal mutant cancer protein-like isoform X1 [Orbicella faveolata]
MSDNENGLSISSASSRRASSESLEDSIRKILNTSDGRVTGFLESPDLSLTCKQLGLEDNGVRDIIAQLGSENDGLVSLEQLRQQVIKGNEKSKVTANNSSDEMSAKKLNDKTSGKESWEIDSGAHDLNGDPTLQQIMSVANSKGQSRSSNFLELANTLHLAALASLKTEIVELTGKVQQLTEERDQLQASLAHAAQERKELIHDYEDRLTSQAQHSEQHITELQSVIAELNKKLSQSTVDKFDESEEHEIESQTSEHGSQSESDSLASEEGVNDDNTDDELSKVVGGLEFAIDRQNTDSMVEEKIPVTVPASKPVEEKATEDTEKKPLHQLQSLSRPVIDTEKTAKEQENLQAKCRELRVQCLDLEKKKQLLERQLQQTSLKEWVSRKKSSGSTGTPDELQSVTSERDGLKAKLKKTELDLEQIKTENQGFREERDRLRRRVLEMQDQLKLLHQKSLQYEQQARTRTNSLQSQGTQPRSPSTPRRNTQPSSGQSGPRMHSRQASLGASSDVSGKEGFLTSPRISRRSSTDSLSMHSHGRGSQPTPNGQVRRPSISEGVWATSDGSPARPLRHPSGSVQSISSQAFWRPGATSDLGSSMHGSQEITVVAKMVDDGTQSPAITGVNCIKALSQLPEFPSGKLPSDLVQALESCRTALDVFKALFTFCDAQADKKLKEYELEIEMLTSRFDHLQAQNNVISLSLEESRNNADRMCVLMGKYESNCTALQLALNFSDRVIETYEVLLQLSEAEQARLFANCRAAGVKTGLHSYVTSCNDSPYRLMYAEEAEAEENDRVPEDVDSCVNRRRTAENEARSLLQKLDRNFESQNGGGQPWESVSSNSRTSSTGSSNDMEFTPEEEARLKSYIQQLKSERSTVGLTVIELESLHEVAQPKDLKLEPLDPKVDLENAVLMQELMALKEEKAELKAKNYLIEKEKKALELKITSRDAQEQAYLVHIEHLKTEMQDEIRRRRRLQKDAGVASSKSDEKSGGSPSGTPSITLAELKTSDEDIPPDLYEAARREKKLKARIQELVETLESLSKNSETRHQQTAEYVADLKKANGALVAAYEKAKKKHGARLRKLEQQMITMVERHDAQVRTMKERISLLEEELKTTTARQNETAL